MKKMRLFIDDFDEIIGRFPLWSTIYLSLDTVSFPCQGWSDATSSVLAMWFDSLSKLLSGHYDRVTLFFMDGDYSVELWWKDRTQAIARFINPDNTTVLQTSIDLMYFVRQMLAAVGKIEMHYGRFSDCSQILELTECAKKLKKQLLSSTI